MKSALSASCPVAAEADDSFARTPEVAETAVPCDQGSTRGLANPIRSGGVQRAVISSRGSQIASQISRNGLFLNALARGIRGLRASANHQKQRLEEPAGSPCWVR